MKNFYDYSVGLNTPYWIQEIRTPRGKLITYFSTPMELSFFVIFILVFIIMLCLSPVVQLLNNITFGVANLLYFYAPYRLARLYCEFEPDGKRMHVFIKDSLNYFFNFSLNKSALYQGVRINEDVETIIFEKTNL